MPPVKSPAAVPADRLSYRVHHIARLMGRSWAARQECIVAALWQYAAVRRSAEDELRALLGEKGFSLVPVDVKAIPGSDVVSYLVDSKTSDKAIFIVSNLREGEEVALRSLNFRRELLVERHVQVLFWLDEEELQSIASRAPDFWAFLHHVVDFTERPADDRSAEAVQTAHALQGDVSFGSAQELYTMIAVRENLLASLPKGYEVERLDLLSSLGTLCYRSGDWARARGYLQQALKLSRKLRRNPEHAVLLHNLGVLAQDRGDLPEASRLYQESLALKREMGDKQGIASTLHQLGNVAYLRGDLPEASRLYQESLALERELGNKQGIASTVSQLGILAQLQGKLEEANRLQQESLTLRRELGDKQGIAICLHQLGILAQDRGDLPEASRLYQESLALDRELGNKQGIAISLAQTALLMEKQERFQEAAALLQEALELFRALGSPTAAQAEASLERVQERLRQVKA